MPDFRDPYLKTPIIRLEVEGMKRTMLLALTEQAALMDKSIQQAVEDFCTEGNIDAIVRHEAQLQLNAALKEEVKSFFLWNGKGRAAVREAVIEALSQRFPDNLESEGGANA
jgi:hypothetical protein